MHFELFQAIFDHVFCTLRGGTVYFLKFIFHTLGGGQRMYGTFHFFKLFP